YYILAATDIDAEQTYEIDGELHGRYTDEHGDPALVTVPAGLQASAIDFGLRPPLFSDSF
ncbi:MAG: hypothetical protein LAT80_15345, partial [Balneolaceae bacterium]|nr:hypothetical protein [Balneolaceae bacterium]